MSMNFAAWLTPVSLLFTLCGAADAQQSGWQVTITELPLLPGGTYSSAYAVNDAGTIVGVASDATGALHTVKWENGQISILPVFSGAAVSVPSDMNDAGEISGTLAVGGQNAGIYWDPQGNALQLPGLPGVFGSFVVTHAINASGQIVGRAQEGSPNLWGHAVVWQGTVFQTDLGFMGGGTYSEALGINDVGVVVGVAALANTNMHAFRWHNGQFTDLGTWTGAGASSKAHAINNDGVIVGLNANVASYWQNGAVHPLPMPPGVSAFTPAIDINAAGDIIATGATLFPDEVGVLWRNGHPINLGTLPGGSRSRARRINGAGMIVGEAQSPSLYFRAVTWTVAPATTAYCTATSNSTGGPGSIRATGSPFRADNDLALLATGLPQSSFGFFLTSRTQRFVAMPGGSVGNLCLGGAIGRYVGPGQVKNTGPIGEFSLPLDLGSTPTPNGFVSIVAGETWNFTTWYRDAVGGAAVSNFTHGLSLRFL